MSADQPFPSFTPTYHHDQYPSIDPAQAALDCSGKVVLITGAGRGIGKAIAAAFGKAHAKGVVLLGRTQATLDESAQDVRQASGGKTDTLVTVADIMEQSQVQAAFDKAIAHFGNKVPDVLVCNAGGALGVGSLTDLDIDEYMKGFDLNAKGPLIVLQTFLRANQKLSPNSPRTVINISSGAAHVPYSPGVSGYGVSKNAGAKIIEHAHHENPSWNIFNVQPGVVATDLSRQTIRKLPDSPELPAGFTVWLAAHPDARHLNGRFIWANWDIDELLSMKEEIHKRELLRLTLKGWADDVSVEELMERLRTAVR